ncbi:alpha/beta hydrolase fold-domain-containing protein [Dactylonectria estremocensis]|uniref:Alpha/beta hydrolase fold-domain-containing protein n=1 Tax=Dactylonectria estremocensis TaxID=1079267 RepID=A0A9P9F1H9_9HYPO|nr:alpha/beta hydrolase fold-domain-containing protein [Dactylonectria estremocensis]
MKVTTAAKTAWASLPLLPLVVRVSLLHMLQLSDAAEYLDLRSSLLVAVVRALLVPSRPRSITDVQKFSTRDDSGPRGTIWVSRYASPVPPETGVRDALIETVERLAAGRTPVPVPDLVDVEAEWTGHRPGAARDSALPAMSERERYHGMMAECSRPTTVLYLHGGAYYLCDPSTHRPTTRKLAKLTGGRCYSVRYRLAPKHPFPSALLDALVSYLTLLYPPPDAYHDPVQPEHIVIAGDSAGGNLALALLQLLMELRNQDSPIMWHGELRLVPLPAGVAANSPWLDMTQSAPTWDESTPTPYDFLPKPSALGRLAVPPCDIWPASPPRKSIYVADALLPHPLASLVMARSWKGAPPIYICAGWEILAWEAKYLARKLEADGVAVVFEEYEAMPHCFALLLRNAPSTSRCYDGWAGFIRAVVEDPEGIAPSAVRVKARTLDEEPLRFDELCSVTDDEMRQRVLLKAEEVPAVSVAKL